MISSSNTNIISRISKYSIFTGDKFSKLSSLSIFIPKLHKKNLSNNLILYCSNNSSFITISFSISSSFSSTLSIIFLSSSILFSFCSSVFLVSSFSSLVFSLFSTSSYISFFSSSSMFGLITILFDI